MSPPSQPPRRSRPRRCDAAARGFTLIELMVVISIVAVMLTLAAPSFVSFQRNSQLTSIANSLAAALNTARSEAMKRNVNAMVLPADSAHADWTKGWIVFVDVDLDGVQDASEPVVMTRDALPPYITMTGTDTASGTPAYLLYDGSGFLRTTAGASAANATLNIGRSDTSGAAAVAQTRRVKVATTGRVRVCTPASTSDAGCAATAGSL